MLKIKKITNEVTPLSNDLKFQFHMLAEMVTGEKLRIEYPDELKYYTSKGREEIDNSLRLIHFHKYCIHNCINSALTMQEYKSLIDTDKGENYDDNVLLNYLGELHFKPDNLNNLLANADLTIMEEDLIRTLISIMTLTGDEKTQAYIKYLSDITEVIQIELSLIGDRKSI